MPYTPDLARASDPETSAEAAGRAIASGTVARHDAWILDALQLARGAGATGSELAAAINRQHGTSLTNVDVMRRMYVLCRSGQVHRRPDPSGRRQYLARGGETLHWLGTRPGQQTLFG